MKKLLAVTMLSMSVCATSVGYAQSMYTEGGYYGSAGLGVEADVGTEGVGAVEWVFRAMTFISFVLALNAAWKDFNSWEGEQGHKPNLDDERIQAVCDFYYDYRSDYDLDGMGKALEDNNYCF